MRSEPTPSLLIGKDFYVLSPYFLIGQQAVPLVSCGTTCQREVSPISPLIEGEETNLPLTSRVSIEALPKCSVSVQP